MKYMSSALILGCSLSLPGLQTSVHAQSSDRGTVTSEAAKAGVSSGNDVQAHAEGWANVKRKMQLAAEHPPTNRSYQDNPDMAGLNMIHFIYAVPKSGVDRGIDLTTTIPYSASSFNNWLATQTGGRVLMLDTFQRHLDITFIKLPQTDRAYDGYGVFKRDHIEADIRGLRRLQPNKIYVVYYEGENQLSCADAPRPPVLPGKVVVIYLNGLANVAGVRPCSSNPFAASPTAAPGYQEFIAIHEILHASGIVSASAPHYTLNGHVSDSPSDLMYAGTQPWTPMVLDVGRDDYYNPSGLPAGVINFAASPFLTRK